MPRFHDEREGTLQHKTGVSHTLQTWKQDKHQNNLQLVDKGSETTIVRLISRSRITPGVNLIPPVF